ncbi:hypothetical protein TWF106_006128 [Orbilia oligospora]|uniref:Elongin-A n=1 Tax=Orbilia oligospora TaxID=2813651 RepID=A0A6G1MR73_ORBOL|nr:hypothetical protein TWF788_000929 [Orbilia oligospora]KAF3220707.1 hypothetical protein TWF679_008903 [Orbilia oligospora]KAF3221529.1 hypothetical protein TWF106_006128 [Orbilia oligospora]KAF3231273.1 hypothetical protein TWF191_006764 [Orbilia oligospora]KAF3265518.1 hypothetical protein TWF192_000168 [Orbilia oligospora]
MYVGPGFPIPTLFELAKRVCIRHINVIDDVGDLPYSIVKPILIRVECPDKLKTIEENCPQLVPEINELWQLFILRDIGESTLHKFLNPLESGDSPEAREIINNTDWSSLYFNLRETKLAKEKAQVDELKKAMKKHNEQKEKRQIGFANVRREDIGKLRMLDKGRSFSGVISGRVGKDPANKVFRNAALNKALIKPGKGRFR